MNQSELKSIERKTVVINYRTAVISIITAIITLIGTFFGGIKIEEINVKKDIITSINITGDNNEVVINNVESLIQNYLQLKLEHEELQKQKDDAASEIAQLTQDINQAYMLMNNKEEQANKTIDELEMKLNNFSSINYKNLGLCIDVEDIPINIDKSFVAIDGREYLSREIVDKLLPGDKIINIKNNTIFIGPVIADKANLFDFKAMDQNNIYLIDSITDSYDNNYSHVLYTRTSYSGSKFIIYHLDRKYSLMKLTLAIRDNADLDSTGILTIKADDKVVYTSEKLYKKMEPYTEKDIPINNCNLLTIEYSPSSFSIDCIISNAEIYN